MSTFTQKWMSYIDGNKRLSELTIPGTHDTGTWTLIPGPAKCQTMTLEQQLNSGIRFLDIRLERGTHSDKVLWVYHGVFSANLSFSGKIMNICNQFLIDNPTETILMSIKNESDPSDDNNKDKFYDDLFSDVNIYHFPNLFYTENRIPSLNEVRGKIVLFRRFGLGTNNNIGIDCYDEWPKDAIGEFCNYGIKFYVQDRYYSWGDKRSNKFTQWIQPCLEKACNDESSNTLYINFSSATGIMGGSLPLTSTPRDLAETVNPLLFDHFKNNTFGRYGIIPMDFPEINSDLIKSLIYSNLYDPNYDFVFYSKTAKEVFLVFEGMAHLVPMNMVTDKIFVNGYQYLFPRINSSSVPLGNPVKNGKIVKFKGEPQIYLSYEDVGFDKPVLRHIPNMEVANAYRLTTTATFGEEDSSKKKEKYQIGTVLTRCKHLDKAPVNNDIVELFSMIGVDKCLDVFENKTADGSKTVICSSNSGKNQQWKIIDSGEAGYFFLEPQNAPGKRLDVSGNVSADGTAIIIQAHNNGDNQKWKVIPSVENPGLFVISPKNAPNSCLDVKGANAADGTDIILHALHTDTAKQANQLWYFHKVN